MSGFLQKLVYGGKEVVPKAPGATAAATSSTDRKVSAIRRLNLKPQTPHARRKEIAEDTIQNAKTVVEKYSDRGASVAGHFYKSLPSLLSSPLKDKNPRFPPSPERKTNVVVADSFEAVRMMVFEHGAAPEKTAVLNLASDIRPAGGWDQTLSETQEEALCYSSTLFITLKPEYYPWDNKAASGIFSPGVVVYKDTLVNTCAVLPEDKVIVTGVITVAAPRWPKLNEDRTDFANKSTADGMKEKIRAVYRMAAVEGRTNIILGAMGCGAYGCPKEAVAREMKNVLLEEEFAGWFERVWWAVFDPLGEGNAGIFGEVCDGVEFK